MLEDLWIFTIDMYVGSHIKRKFQIPQEIFEQNEKTISVAKNWSKYCSLEIMEML